MFAIKFAYFTYGCFLKWWYQTTIGFPTQNDHFAVFWGYHHFRKHPYSFAWKNTYGMTWPDVVESKHSSEKFVVARRHFLVAARNRSDLAVDFDGGVLT